MLQGTTLLNSAADWLQSCDNEPNSMLFALALQIVTV